ncbi:MAG: sugar nucleotide-binding protein [Alphaproteobacteria bacterium]|nr:sugar nucleotide-binding protein [Alphaproteobacteria bacterium]
MRCDVLVAGGEGLIGRALVRRARRSGARVVYTSRRSVADAAPDVMALDLAAPPATWRSLLAAATVMIAAAVSTLAGCAAAPSASGRVNVDGTLALARMAAERGAYVLFLSSNQVFDGRLPRRCRYDARCPISEYGRQKALGEKGTLALGAQGCVLRLTKVIDRATVPLQGWLGDLAAGRPVAPVRDLTVAPVAVGFVLDVIERLIATRASGLYHALGAEGVSYETLALALADAGHARRDLLCPRTLTAPPAGLAAIPRYTSLEMDEESRCFGFAPPTLAPTLELALTA